MESTTISPKRTMLSLASQYDRELENFPPQPQPAAAEPAEQEPQPKPNTKTTKSKPPKAPPLPATVKVLGYEVTIPTTKICWRVNFVHDCGHPVMKISQERYPGCDTPLIAEVNRHMRPCTARCKIEKMEHTVEGECEICHQLEQRETAEALSFWAEGDNESSDIVWDEMPGI